LERRQYRANLRRFEETDPVDIDVIRGARCIAIDSESGRGVEAGYLEVVGGNVGWTGAVGAERGHKMEGGQRCLQHHRTRPVLSTLHGVTVNTGLVTFCDSRGDTVRYAYAPDRRCHSVTYRVGVHA